jgi:phage/plasmid-like protein (TIGR03299 family)
MARLTKDFAERQKMGLLNHNLSFDKEGNAEVFVAGEEAWHKLGVNVQSAQKWEEAYKLARLDWTISREQLKDIRNNLISAYGIFRNDSNVLLSTCGDRYTPIQNKDAFTFVNALVESDIGCHFVSAGAIGKGETIWCIASIPAEISIKGTDDKMIPYLLFIEHRDKQASVVKYSYNRPVCQNTLNLSMFDGNKIFHLRHTSGVVDKMKRAKEVLSAVKGQCKSLEEKMNFLAQKKVNVETIGTVLKRLFPEIETSTASQNKARDILLRYENNDGNVFPSERGTAFNLLNAITGYVDHDRSVRVGKYDIDVPEGFNSDVELDKNEVQKRAISANFGSGDVFKNRAYEYILEAVETTGSKKSSVDNILDKVAI